MFQNKTRADSRKINHFFYGEKNVSGFTLIEIVVVMVIITIIVASISISFQSDNNPTARKNIALNIYKNMTYLQEESLLGGSLLGVFIEELNSVDSDSFDEVSSYDIKWLKWVVKEAEPEEEEDDEGENEMLDAFGQALPSSTINKRRLKRRFWEPLEDKVLNEIHIPSYFNAYIELDGIRRDFSEISANNSSKNTVFESDALKVAEGDEKGGLEKEKISPIIYFEPDGTVTDFKLVLVNKEDDSQGFFIKSVNQQALSFGYLGEEE